MKKVSLFLLCGIFLLMLTSCNTYEFTTPSLGLWRSNNPVITFEVTDESGRYYGTYVKEGEEIEIRVSFGRLSNIIEIYDIAVETQNGATRYFTGRFEIKGNKMYLKFTSYAQEIYGIKQIVFTKQP